MEDSSPQHIRMVLSKILYHMKEGEINMGRIIVRFAFVASLVVRFETLEEKRHLIDGVVLEGINNLEGWVFPILHTRGGGSWKDSWNLLHKLRG